MMFPPLPDGIHAIFIPGIIEFSRCIRTYSNVKFEFYIYIIIEESMKNNRKLKSGQ